MVPVTIFLVACAAPPSPQPSATPQRIVSLIPAVTETLFAVGAGSKVVGVGTYDAHPPDVRQLPRVGGLIDADTERILALKPDLVFAYRSQEELVTQLRTAGIPVEVYRHGNLADVIASIRAIGRRVGHEADAERTALGIERVIGEVRSRASGQPAPSVLVVFGREEGTLRGIYASGGVGFIHDMLVAAGGRNVFEDVPRESVQASLESIIERAPDIVLEIRAPFADRSHAAEDLTSPWTAAPSLPAVRHGRVRAIIDERVVIPGPRVAEGLLLFEQALRR